MSSFAPLRVGQSGMTIVLTALLLGPAASPLFGDECHRFWDTSIGTPGFNGNVRAFAILDYGSGPTLYAGGHFFGDQNGLAKWRGGRWQEIGGGLHDPGRVFCLLVREDGAEPVLYAGGTFARAGAVAANNIAKWDGHSWTALGGGMSGGFSNTIVYALAVFDDGGGPALYAAGRFVYADNNPVNHIAKWDGERWSDLGGGMEGMVELDRLNALAVYDDGSGPALYVGGMFTGAGGVSAVGIARWDGTSWSDVGGGMGGERPHVRALTVFDDGTGSALYVGGQFFSAGGVAARCVARWDGGSWTALGAGFASNPWVTSLAVFDDGTGPALYAGGKFTLSAGQTVNRITRWTGSVWAPLRDGVDDNVYAVHVFDDGGGPDLYVGGRFATADGHLSNRVARWDCLPVVLADELGSSSRSVWAGDIEGDIDEDGDVDLTDLAILLAAYGFCEGDLGFIPAADIDGSGCVDLADLAALLANYGIGT